MGQPIPMRVVGMRHLRFGAEGGIHGMKSELPQVSP